MFIRQSTEEFGKISKIFYMKVISDSQIDSRLVRDTSSVIFTALAGVFNDTDTEPRCSHLEIWIFRACCIRQSLVLCLHVA